MDDHAALTGAHGLPLLRSGFGVARLFFNAVEVLDLQQHPSGLLRRAFGYFVELMPRMGPTCSQDDVSFAAIGERGVGGVSIALQGALKIEGEESVQTSHCTTGGPGEAHVGSGAFAGPEVALFGVLDDNILAVFIDFIIVARSMNISIMILTRLGLFAVLGLTSCSNMNPGASAALIGGLSGAAAGIIARQAGLSNSQSVLIGSAVGIAAGTITYNYHKRRATERELATARLRAAQYQNQVSSGSKPRSKTRYIAVPATASKTSSQAASTVVLFDTQTNSAVGNNVYEMDQRPKKGDVVKFDTFNAEYVGL